MANKIISFVLKTSKQQSDQVGCISPLDTYISRALWFVPWMTARILSSLSLVIWSANIKVETKSQLSIQKPERDSSLKCAIRALLSLWQAVTLKWADENCQEVALAEQSHFTAPQREESFCFINFRMLSPVSHAGCLKSFIQWKLLNALSRSLGPTWSSSNHCDQDSYWLYIYCSCI